MQRLLPSNHLAKVVTNIHYWVKTIHKLKGQDT
jgi:hypothetical protein